MKNYKIIYERPIISFQESGQLADFDGLLSMYQGYRKPRFFSNRQLKVLGMLIWVTALLFYGIYKDTYVLETSEATNTKIEENFDQKISQGDIESVSKDTMAMYGQNQLPTEVGVDIGNSRKSIKPEIQGADAPANVKSSDVITQGYQEAEPVDGFPALYEYFDERLVYPKEIAEKGIEGSVIVRFEIDTSGHPVDVTIEKSLHEGLEKEAIDLIENMPKWHPAYLNGKPIKSTHRIPLYFQIEETTERK